MSQVAILPTLPSADDAMEDFWDATISSWATAVQAVAQEIKANPEDRDELITQLEKLVECIKRLPHAQ